jgi:hypothetical protein
MKFSLTFMLPILLFFNATAQQSGSEFPELVFNGTLISVSATGKAHQSYIFTMQIDSVLTGDYSEKQIQFECFAGFHGNELLEYFNCITGNADLPHSCYGSGKVTLLARNFHDEIIYLFLSISPVQD